MYTRTFPVSNLYINYEFGGTPPESLNAVTTRFIFKDVRTRTGVANRHWRQQIRSGQNASTAFNGTSYGFTYTGGMGNIKYYHPSKATPGATIREVVTRNGDLVAVAMSTLFPNPPAPAENQALIRVYKDIRDTQYQLSGPTFIGELRETIKMLKRPMNGMRQYADKYLRALKTRRGRTGNPSRMVADTWLEYSFGWSPFLSDIKSAAETLARFNTDIRRGTAKGFGEYSIAEYTGLRTAGASTNAGIPYFATQTKTTSCKVIYRCGINADLAADEGSTARLIQLSGFQMQNFIPTVWELLPWSFLIDYFSNIGNVIEAGCTDTSSVTRTTRNVVDELLVKRTIAPDQPALKALYGGNLYSFTTARLGSWTFFSRRFDRKVMALSYPTLEFKLPGKPGQLANMAALIVTGRRMQPYT